MKDLFKVGVIWAAMMIAGVSVGLSHNAPGGWTYDYDCCGGDPTGAHPHGDCYPVPDVTIREVQGGFEVTLSGRDHPLVRIPIAEVVPHGDPRLRVSGDEKKHACVLAGRLLCIYLPPGGV